MQRAYLLVLTFSALFFASIAIVYAEVEIESFIGSWQKNPERVVLQFSTRSQVNHAAFNVWRSTTNLSPSEVNTGTAIKLNATIILNNPCRDTGEDYTFEDTQVEPTVAVYYYYLESITCDAGASSFYGPPSSNGGLIVINPDVFPVQRVHLPLINVE